MGLPLAEPLPLTGASLPRLPLWRLWGLRRLNEGHVEPLRAILEDFPDGFEVRFPGSRVLFLNNPGLVELFLVKNHKCYIRDRASMGLKRVMGNGVLTSEGEFHLQQRRLIQPAFHKKRIDAYADTMARIATEHAAQWRDGDTIDLSAEMMEVTLRIISQTMFSADVAEDVETVSRSLNTLLPYIDRYLVPSLGTLLDRLPLPSTLRIRKAIEDLDAIVYRFIREHREANVDNGDLLSLLLSARYDDGTGMPDQQVRDEAITLFLAGHETTATALTWTFVLLARHPEIEARLHEEVDAVLEGGRPATADDVPRLEYTRRVFTESMRIYAPVPGFSREAVADNDLGPVRVRKGDMVVVAPYTMHHDPRQFTEPERFDPDRWLPERAAGVHKFAYFPFGGGARKCIGEPFAWMEGVLLLATYARHWRFLRENAHAPVPVQVTVTLRPRGGLPVRLARR